MARSIFVCFLRVFGSAMLDSSIDMFKTSLWLAVINISSRFVWILAISFSTYFFLFSSMSMLATFSAY